jgi:hypothetical protein
MDAPQPGRGAGEVRDGAATGLGERRTADDLRRALEVS